MWLGGHFFIGRWGWLEVYFRWIGLGGHLLLMDGDGWVKGMDSGIFWMDGGGRYFLWVARGGWRYILGE